MLASSPSRKSLAMPWASLIVSELARGRGLESAGVAVDADGWVTLATPVLPGPVEKLPEVEPEDSGISDALTQVRFSLPKRFVECANPFRKGLSIIFVKLASILKL
jgi:hypothetical protein